MNLDRMLEMCRRDQWRLSDLDWTQPPRAFSRDDEVAIVQLFTDMAGIERLAGALFAEQVKRVSDPRLKEIFRSFVRDEARHAAVAERLARHYDVHRYRQYAVNVHLARFAPHFVKAVRHLADDVANGYITAGELILDIALLRSINDYVADDMSQAAMNLINRDESRHVAIDYHMMEFYSSEEYTQIERSRPPRSFTLRLRSWWTFVNMIWFAKPFARAVFFEPMDRVDPAGHRLKEAFKRIQLLGRKPGLANRPFSRFLQLVHDGFNHPVFGRLFGGVFVRLAGLDPRVMVMLYDDEEAARADRSSFDEMATEALSAKYAA